MDDRIGYRDQWDYDVQHGICPICGPPYRTPNCTGCNPPVRTYTYACGATLTTDDDDYGCPEHGQTCRRVKTEILRPPTR